MVVPQHNHGIQAEMDKAIGILETNETASTRLYEWLEIYVQSPSN